MGRVAHRPLTAGPGRFGPEVTPNPNHLYPKLMVLRDNDEVTFRNFAHVFVPGLLLAVLCLAQGDWQTAADLPGVDMTGLTPAQKQGALKYMRTEQCNCGCNMKIAECRMKDHTCAYSRKLATLAVKKFGEGKSAAVVKNEIYKEALQPPPVLESPIRISTAGDPVRGPLTAKVTIIEFSDFQCPYCTKAVAEAKEIEREFPRDVKLIFKQFPLDTHADAEFGAEASLAAQEQGKFWEMHDLLYAGFPNLSRNTVLGYAKELHLDMNRFVRDLDSHKFRARVQMEEQEGESAGVGGTPTFFIDGKKYNGLFDVASIVPIVKKELKN